MLNDITNEIAMRLRIGSWGGSHAIRLPKAAVDALGLREGQDVDLEINEGALVVRPGRPRYSLGQLVADAQACEPPVPGDDDPFGHEAL